MRVQVGDAMSHEEIDHVSEIVFICILKDKQVSRDARGRMY